MSFRLFSYVFAVSFVLTFDVNAKNLYNDWAQKNATNLVNPTDSSGRSQNSNAPLLQRIKNDALSCKDEWSGSLNDLKALVDRAKQKYGRESTKHMGRNATMIVPANLSEMKRWGEETWTDRMKQWLGLGDKPLGNFVECKLDGYHAKDAEKDDGFWDAARKTIGSGVKKYQVEKGPFMGAEVVYDEETGEIVKDWRMGTRNYSYVMSRRTIAPIVPQIWDIVVNTITHNVLDMKTHEKNPEYKYVGILVETDPFDPNKYYIVNGQTGKRMSWREAEDFPTTLSDEWKDMGLACAPDDANDVIEPDECRDEAKCASETTQPDLHSLNLDDPNGDWCKCEERGEKPGCKANMDPVKGYVFFGCTKCKKVNVKYAKMALELEQKMKDAGVHGTWFGQNAKENAHKAAFEPSK